MLRQCWCDVLAKFKDLGAQGFQIMDHPHHVQQTTIAAAPTADPDSDCSSLLLMMVLLLPWP